MLNIMIGLIGCVNHHDHVVMILMTQDKWNDDMMMISWLTRNVTVAMQLQLREVEMAHICRNQYKLEQELAFQELDAKFQPNQHLNLPVLSATCMYTVQ